MKRCLLSIAACFTIVTSPLAYEEWSVSDLIAPATVKPFGLEAGFQHKFLGRIDGNDNAGRLFGMGDGADAALTLRATVWSRTQVFVSYDNLQVFSHSHNEFTIGASCAMFVPWAFLRLQAGGEYYSYASVLVFPEERKNNFFFLGALQNDPLFGRIAGLVNIGYDFDKKAFGLGLGIDIKIVDAGDVFGEYFPVVDKKDDPVFNRGTIYNPFSFGVKISTAGHQFIIYTGNATEIGPRHLMRGASDNFLRFGFEIKRLFSFP